MDLSKLVESFGVNERKILPYINEKLSEICKKSQLDSTSVLRALRYLENKGAVKLTFKKKKIVEIGVNGALYRKKGLPERRLVNLINEKRILKFDEAQKESKLSDDEFKIAIGVLRKKAMIEIKNGKIILSANQNEISKKMLEESFLESLPADYESLNPEQLYSLKSLENRKNIVQIKEKNLVNIQPTELGKKLISYKIKDKEVIEQITTDVIQKESWKGKKFRRYDLTSPLPKINGGKRHFVAQASDYARKIWTEMGFREMTGNIAVSSFWNFDALFTAQDHPVREMQDTFFLNRKTALPEKSLVKSVKEVHETGTGKNLKSKGWQYSWDEEEAKKLVLRTHTTCLSAQTLAKLKKEDLPAKFFAIGKCFRNETVDWSHGFEFNQTEGIVIDRNANFRHLLGYLKEFFKKMGFEKIRFRPSYFPYTEPSVEIDVWHPERKIWLELGGAGIFRPEVVIPLMGEYVPVLAWGPGLDRLLVDYYKIKDLRELYKNDLTQLRNTKFWMK